MGREPRDDDAYQDLGDGERDGPREPRSIHPLAPVQLVTEDVVEEDVASMCRIWGVYVTSGVLGQYREVLRGLPPAAVHEAVMEWLRHPAAERAARPHELRTMAEAQLKRQPARGPVVTTLAPPKQDLDKIFAELARENPENTILHGLIKDRERRKATGQEVSPQGTMGWLGQQWLQGRVLTQTQGTNGDRSSSNVPASEHP